MAKKVKTNGDSVTATASTESETLETLVLSRDGFEVRWADLPEKSRVRMARKAFNELMQDSTAFSKEDLEGKSDDEIAAMKAEARKGRFDSIVSGEFKTGGGGARLPTIERIMNEIARDHVKAMLTAKGIKAVKLPHPETGEPTDTPVGKAMPELIKRWLAKNGDAARVEAQSRIDNAKSATGNVDDILS